MDLVISCEVSFLGPHGSMRGLFPLERMSKNGFQIRHADRLTTQRLLWTRNCIGCFGWKARPHTRSHYWCSSGSGRPQRTQRTAQWTQRTQLSGPRGRPSGPRRPSGPSGTAAGAADPADLTDPAIPTDPADTECASGPNGPNSPSSLNGPSRFRGFGGPNRPSGASGPSRLRKPYLKPVGC